ncbi:hypothetical protein CNY89_23450, partial [Amaricoccus sp. HAR-UPW-R2A-40]
MRVIHAAADSLTPSQHHAQTPPSALPERPDRQPVGDDRANDPGRTSGGRPRKADKREIVEAILYFLRAGCAWRLLP